MTAPRIPPLPEDQRTPRQQALIDDLVQGPTVNIYTTLARHPDTAAAMVNLGRTLRGGRLPVRDREVLILRTGWNCQSAYEFAQHRRVALTIGMTLDDIRRIQDGPDAAGWDGFECLLCRAADELHHEHGLRDTTWAGLAERYDEQQLIEAVLLVGYYHLVSFALNALRVPIEPGAEAFVGDD
ncbi:MAG TPA: carboxymuconolactone decarboxylase family protein [Acidimicrobiia bacterium]|nr:carboxymuconolactone decarboxylase family protein [Acidimicrobiia bacterium]